MRRDHNESNNSRERLLSCLLTEMDGIINHERDKIFILAATQNKDDLDAAILRPGRLDLHIYFPLPNYSQRLLKICSFLKICHLHFPPIITRVIDSQS